MHVAESLLLGAAMATERQIERALRGPAPPHGPPPDPPREAELDRAALLSGFAASPELAALAPEDRELLWVEALLEVVEGWGWAELDIHGLGAALFDGLGWVIQAPPADAGRVARVLGAFMAFAGRVHGAPHAAECCAYLWSPQAEREIADWVAPVDPGPQAELGASSSWCDRRCDRCMLSATCPQPREELPLLGARAGTRDRGVEPAAGARLRRRSRDLARALTAVADVAGAALDPEARAEVRAAAVLVATRGARVAAYLSPAGRLEDEGALLDGVPNLVLIDHLLAVSEARLAGVIADPAAEADFSAALAELRRLLDPLLAAVPRAHVEELELLVLAGRAPSPFVTRSPQR